jgi:charged multivesicular body protein 1
MATKCEKEHEAEKLKIKKAIEKGDPETARIYAQSAIRMKTTGLNYLRLSSRLDAVASRVESAVKMKQVTQQMGNVTKGMDKVLASMDIGQITKVMDKFEASFEDMDVKSQYVENAMNSATSSSTPEDQVESLMQQVSDAHNLDFKARAADASRAPVQVAQEEAAGDSSLEKRLAALRG